MESRMAIACTSVRIRGGRVRESDVWDVILVVALDLALLLFAVGLHIGQRLVLAYIGPMSVPAP